MRPENLHPLFMSVMSLPGVGGKLNTYLTKLLGDNRVKDLLFLKPSNIIDRRYSPKIAEAEIGKVCTLEIEVVKHDESNRYKKVHQVLCRDDSGFINIAFFKPHVSWLRTQLPPGEKRIVSGTVEEFKGFKQMTHPDFIEKIENKSKIQTIEAVYPLTAGLSKKVLGKTIKQAVERTPYLPEWNDKHLMEKKKWLSWEESLIKIHNPENLHDISDNTPAKDRLAYDEILAMQLALAYVRHNQKEKQGIVIDGVIDQLHNNLPFSLTKAQQRAINEILEDMKSPHKMMRLLQGDVGAGKTIVALFACVNAVSAGYQASIMAPTEILARQHFEGISKLCENLNIKVEFLTGRHKGKYREEILENIKSGEAQIVIGTHALFQESVEFKNLALAVIDEQHRFGVHQRMMLSEKGSQIDCLVMSATPIPRTLTLTLYGDMDISILDEKPANRKEIQTSVLNNNKLDSLVHSLEDKINNGEKIYWVCPLVEESEKMDLAAATERYQELRKYFGDIVGLVHGKMKSDEKKQAMEDFVSGKTKILVATTVIEVGVDVKDASIMVIEHSERFGLSQLHQLRGRVGRGDKQSYCVLVYSHPISQDGRKRLEIMRKTNDGFVIAEEDLSIRGGGEILGTKQSGITEFKFADYALHKELFNTARQDAKVIMETDPHLKSERGKALRVLLYLFEQDLGIKYLGN